MHSRQHPLRKGVVYGLLPDRVEAVDHRLEVINITVHVPVNGHSRHRDTALRLS
jgi:hypothetical protein